MTRQFWSPGVSVFLVASGSLSTLTSASHATHGYSSVGALAQVTWLPQSVLRFHYLELTGATGRDW